MAFHGATLAYALFALSLFALSTKVECRLRLNFPQSATSSQHGGVETLASPKHEEPFRPGYYVEFSNPLWYLISRTKDMFIRPGRNDKGKMGAINWRRLINPMDMGSFQLMQHKSIRTKKNKTLQSVASKKP